MKRIFVNNKKIITKGFRGINFIHHLYNYMPDEENRMNTPKLIELELETLKKMGVKQVRSYYGSSLSWDEEKGVHDFESEWMQAFYKNCKDLEKLGIEIGITPQWSFKGFLNHCEGSQGVNVRYNGFYVDGDIEATAKNFEKFVEESVYAFERHSVTNIKYFYCFTECNTAISEPKGAGEKTKTYYERRNYEKLIPYYDRFIRAVDTGLKNAGMRDKYKIVAPCDNWRADDGSEPYSVLTKYTVENLADKVDIIGSHNGYDRANTFNEDAFYDLPFQKLTNPKQVAQAYGKEYWADEFNVTLHSTYTAKEHRKKDNDPMKGVALGALCNSIMNMGYVHNILLWALYNQQWPNHYAGQVNNEFENGVHIVGYIPNLRESTVPHNSWYSCAMLTRYIGTGDVFECQIDRPVYASAINRDDGELTVVVTSYLDKPTDIEVSFAESIDGKTLYRYLYDPKTIKQTEGCKMIESDSLKEKVTDLFTDTLPAYCVAVYTTKKD